MLLTDESKFVVIIEGRFQPTSAEIYPTEIQVLTPGAKLFTNERSLKERSAGELKGHSTEGGAGADQMQNSLHKRPTGAGGGGPG